MNQPKCLSESELSDYMQGRLPAHLVDNIEEHVEECGDCQSTLALLGEQSDTFVSELRRPAAVDSIEGEPACRSGLARLLDTGYRSAAPPAGEMDRIGPYVIVGQLGAGGMGTVFEATHRKLKRTVALKILPVSRWANSAAIARFEREMEVIGQLDHPNIVRANDAGEENGMHYLVMEHVDGLDLSRLVSRLGPLPVADACEIARQAAIGLQYAHENHLVHRDIKPSNLMLQRRHTQRGGDNGLVLVKILDLGLALLGEEHTSHANELTTVGQLMGTLDYMSPEQGMDSHAVDIRSDIYSLGATLYKLLTGQAPFDGPQYNTLLKKVTALANKPSPSIQEERPELPAELAAIIDRMLAKDPDQRLESPQEVAAALEPFVAGADLSRLLNRGLKVKEQASDSSFAQHTASLPPKRFPATPTAKLSVMRWTWWTSLLACLLICGGVSAAVLIYLKTDQGELVVRAADGAQLGIRRAGEPVRQLQVHPGDNAITVRSGEYAIELVGASDELVLSQGSVSVRRGKQVLVEIRHQPSPEGDLVTSGSASATSAGRLGIPPAANTPRAAAASRVGANQPASELVYGADDYELDQTAILQSGALTYSGKTYSTWLSELKTERNPAQLTLAISAFAALGEDDLALATRSTTAILHLMRRYGARIIDSGPRGMLIEQAREVLMQMPTGVVIKALENEIVQGTTRSRAFVNYFLSNVVYSTTGRSVGLTEMAWAVENEGEQLMRSLTKLPDDEVAAVRADALNLVVAYAKKEGLAIRDVEGLYRRLQDGLRSNDATMLSAATTAIIEIEPDNEELVPALTRRVRLVKPSSNPLGLRNAIVALGKLGPRAEPAVDELIELLTQLADTSDGGLPMAMLQAGGMYGGGGGMIPSNQTDPYYAAVETLGRIGPAAKRALPVLREVLRLSNEQPTRYISSYVAPVKKAIAQIAAPGMEATVVRPPE